MKTTAKIKRPVQRTCGIRTPMLKGTGNGWRGRPKSYKEGFFKVNPRGHGPLDELERKLAAI